MKEKKYVIENEELMKEWDWDKNNNLGLNPNQLTYGSNFKVHWRCENGHMWQASINHRANRTQGCPYCSGRLVIEGKNDLLTVNRDLAAEWDCEKNIMAPSEVKAHSHKIVWWKCKKGHSYKCSVDKRMAGQNCPYCNNKKVLLGYNDLASTHIEIAADWNYDKNAGKSPSHFTYGSEREVWWKCSVCNFEWKARINSRCVSGTGCPNCFKYYSTSFQEQCILFYLDKANVTVLNRYNIKGNEVDIYLPDFKCGIEYDGYQWHKEKFLKDNEKDMILCMDISLIRIRENGLLKTDKAINIFRENRSTKDLERIISEVFCILKIDTPTININKDRNKIIAKYIVARKKKSLEFTNPELISEWNYIKNDTLLPRMVAQNCNEKVWWKCNKCGNEWEAVISNRVKGSSCPRCAWNQRKETRKKNLIKKGKGVFEKYPDLEMEWDYNENKVDPKTLSYGSSEKVWWKCKNGHKWMATINSRTHRHCGCPICANKLSGKSQMKEIIQIDIETGNIIQIYESVSEAKRQTKINNISAAINGRIKSAGGYYWKINE